MTVSAFGLEAIRMVEERSAMADAVLEVVVDRGHLVVLDQKDRLGELLLAAVRGE